MSVIRIFGLLAGLALGVLALTSSAAMAQETEVSVVHEETHAACEPCVVHMVGESVASSNTGMVVSACEDELDLTLFADGTGEVTRTPNHHGGSSCVAWNCSEPAETHWPISGLGELGAGHAHVTIEFCLDSITQGDIHCTAEFDIDGGHFDSLSVTNHPCAGGSFRFTGEWTAEDSAVAIERHGGDVPQVTEVAVVDEATHEPCDPTCAIHAVGESRVVSGLGALLSVCADELDLTLNASGWGGLSWSGTAHGAPGCTVSNCNDLNEQRWPVGRMGELRTGNEHFMLDFCLFSPTIGQDVHCTGEVSIVDADLHDYELTLSDHPCANGLIRVTGSWSFEGSPVEIEHHDDDDPQRTEVSVVEEATHAPCDPCTVHAVGEATIVSGVGSPLSACEDEFDISLAADGSGEATWGGTAHVAPGCTVSNCNDVAERHWPISDFGEVGSGVEHATIAFCLFSPTLGADVHCTGTAEIVDVGLHDYTLSLTDHPCAWGLFRITGSWQVEGSPVEIEHHDDNV